MGHNRGATTGTRPADRRDIALAAALLMDVANRVSMTLAEGIAPAGNVDGPTSRHAESTTADPPNVWHREPDTRSLSPREREVVSLIARGYSNRQIAETLCISIATVERHVSNIFNKLGIRARALVAVWATQNGLALARAR